MILDFIHLSVAFFSHHLHQSDKVVVTQLVLCADQFFDRLVVLDPHSGEQALQVLLVKISHLPRVERIEQHLVRTSYVRVYDCVQQLFYLSVCELQALLVVNQRYVGQHIVEVQSQVHLCTYFLNA